MENKMFSIDAIYENFSFLISNENFENDFFKNLENKEKQDLFGYLLNVLPSIILSDYRKFNKDELKSSNILEKQLFFEIVNIRIDLKSFHDKLIESEEKDFVQKVNKAKIISDLSLFIIQFVFINLSQCIVATEIDTKPFKFDIKRDSKKHTKYRNSDKITTADRSVVQNNFVIGYENSFETNNYEKIKIIEKELIFMSNISNQKKRINSIFDEGITFSDSVTNTTRNKLLRCFFKEVIAKFFYNNLNTNSLDDFEVKDAFRAFRKRA